MNKILSKFLIQDLVNIVNEFLYTEMEEFTKDFVDECIDTGNYYYRTKDISLIHYLFDNNNTMYVLLMLIKSPYLNIEHFQNKNIYGQTELFKICCCEWDILYRMSNLNIKYFLNKDKKNKSELYILCVVKKSANLNAVIDYNKNNLKMEYFQNISLDEKHTELWWLCKNSMGNIIKLIPELEMMYFQNNLDHENEEQCTELWWLCKNNMGNIIKLIPNLEMMYFHNTLEYDRREGCTELWWLCRNSMGNIIKLISKKFSIEDFDITCSERYETEFFQLCKQNMKEIIVLITDLKITDFNTEDSYANYAKSYIDEDTKNYIINKFPYLNELKD